MVDVWRQSHTQEAHDLGEELRARYVKEFDALVAPRRKAFRRMFQRFQTKLPPEKRLSVSADTVLDTARDLFPLDLLRSAAFSASQLMVNPMALIAGEFVPRDLGEAWNQAGGREMERRQLDGKRKRGDSPQDEEQEDGDEEENVQEDKKAGRRASSSKRPKKDKKAVK